MNSKSCPTCGALIEADSPEGICPACLMKKALESGTSARGARLQCLVCQSTLGEDARFCANCGAPAPVIPASEGDPLRLALEAKLKGQYRLVRLLGQGGMGAVYLARDLTLDREVAIKVIKTNSDNREVYDRFRREAQTAARLSHPNIVPLHAFGEVEGMPYFVMGYVRGESLATRLRREGKLPEEEAREILAEIADALDHAHRQGIVHRDIKPDNVLLEDESGRALLTDFGVAKALGKNETLTAVGSVVGTPHYMSPEQVAGRADLDGRSDIYSLGVMAYAMLAGRLPFEGGTPGDILKKHLTQEPPPLKLLAPTLSDSTIQAVERCLAKDPAHRWPDGRALRATLGTIEEHSLPDALEAVQGHGLAFIVIGAALLSLVWMVVIRLQHAPMGVLGLNIAIILACYVAIVANLRLEGFPIALAQRVIWSEPSWWPYWYPRALRRRGNVWDRLPRSVRRLRWFTPIMVICLLATAVDLSLVTTAIDPDPNITKKLLAFTLIILSIGILLDFAVKRQLKRMGITSVNDFYRIAFSTPPSRLRFWGQPRIGVVLASLAERESLRRVEAPHDYLQSILRIANEMSGPLRPLGTEAAAAARQLIAAIEQSDKQIADLARNIEPGEEERLIEKIEAMADIEESAPMRMLIEKQLELIRELSGRVERAREDRNRRIEMLKTLALHLASLLARCAEPPTEVRPLSDRVRSLCDEIGGKAQTEAQTVAAIGIDETMPIRSAPNDTKGKS